MKIVDKAAGIAGAFDFKLNHVVHFVPDSTKEEKTAQKVTQMSVGSTIPLSRWPSKCIMLIWATKWGVLGLTPIRPLLLFKGSFNIPPGKAVEVTAKND